MKYLGKETQVEVKTKSVRKVEYMRCDGCGKKILPGGYKTEKNEYVSIHTWHSDWGSESVESHEYKDYCKECAKSFVSAYIDEMEGTEELEHQHLWNDELLDGYRKYDDGYALVEEDRK